MPFNTKFLATTAIVAGGLLSSPLAAEETAAEEIAPEANAAEGSSLAKTALSLADPRQDPPSGPPAGPPSGPPAGAPNFKPVFDDTWATVGIGAGLVPSYSGSNDYRAFPLPLIVGRVGGVGISPNGPGFALNVLSEAPSFAPPETSFSFGPSFRFRNDRANQIQDDVVELAEPLDTAIEVGVNAGVSFPGVLAPRDRVTLSAQVSHDILGAHDGLIVSPSVGYFTPVGRAASLQLSANVTIVDDSYADYYYSVTPQQSADTGLGLFTADGGVESVGLIAITTYDLDGNALNGGFSIYGIAGYSRLVGDAADTPFTSVRGTPNQVIGGIGVAYTF